MQQTDGFEVNTNTLEIDIDLFTCNRCGVRSETFKTELEHEFKYSGYEIRICFLRSRDSRIFSSGCSRVALQVTPDNEIKTIMSRISKVFNNCAKQPS